MTPHSLAFYLSVVTTGTVLGAKPADTPERVAALLGPDFAENSLDDTGMWRDYGLAEFYWTRSSAAGPWEGHHFSLQVHRLAHGGTGKLVGEAVRDRYGRFGRRLRFEKLRRLLERRGTALLEVPDPWNGPHYRLYWQPESQVAVSVVGEREEYLTPRNLQPGDVCRISAPMTPEEVARHRSHGRG
ncbi:hypothetical protein ACSNOH_12710 [Streptomyces sp. URMC 127]|uniref:hypothetical protein n=1 Tax=Streptomyces sp. URMC 127 TaxID=3423402 RepID=UPI003F1CBEE3